MCSRLHELPESALQNVLRHLSSKPSRINWAGFVPFEDALTVVHPLSILREVALSLFTRLSVTRRGVNGEEDELRLLFPNDSDPSLLSKWFQCPGGSLSEFTYVGNLTALDPEAMELMVKAFEENCILLRELMVFSLDYHQPEPARTFLEKFRDRVRIVDARGSLLDDISFEMHYTGLRTLEISGAPHRAQRILRVAGPTLEAIHIKELLTGSDMDILGQIR